MLPTALIAVVLLPIAGLAVLSLLARQPDNLGVRDGRLGDCPSTPNCVSTFATSESQRMDPIPFDGTADATRARLRSVLSRLPRTTIVSEADNYLHAECATKLFRFVDDVEFLIDTDAGLIHFRSASRVGHSDLGENRRRMERIVNDLGSGWQ
ncbi:DUF1499 domain-containing protein [bacterium]|nr:DUF1499 domain-containing protein [bacterium]